MSDVEVWTQSAGGNISAPPDGAPENMLRPGVNDVMREIMAAVRRWYQDPHWIFALNGITVTRDSGTVLRIAGVDLTALFVTDRRIRVEGDGGDVEGFVVSSAFAGDTTVTVEIDTGGSSVPVSTTYRLLFSGASLKRAAFRNVLDAAEALTPATKVVSIGGLDTALAGSAFLGTSAEVDTGTNPADVPLNSDLGSAAYIDEGTGSAEIPTVATVQSLLPGTYLQTVKSAAQGNQAAAATPPHGLTDLIGLAYPAGGANGVRKYRVQAWVAVEDEAGSADFELAIHSGPLGTSSDPVVTKVRLNDKTLSAGEPQDIHVGPFILQPGSGDTLTASYNVVAGGGSSCDIVTSNNRTRVLMEEVVK